jgi:hypothetical protein
MPAKKPAAQPPATPFSASCVSRWFATMDSVAANVVPMAAANDAEIITDYDLYFQTKSLQEHTEETDGPASSREESGCTFGVGPQCVLHAADEGADQGSLHSDCRSILKRRPWFEARRIR